MILCPACGKVEEYCIKESAHRYRRYNKNNERGYTTEYTGFQYDQPRCLKCGRVVDFYVDSDADDENKEG